MKQIYFEYKDTFLEIIGRNPGISREEFIAELAVRGIVLSKNNVFLIIKILKDKELIEGLREALAAQEKLYLKGEAPVLTLNQRTVLKTIRENPDGMLYKDLQQSCNKAGKVFSIDHLRNIVKALEEKSLVATQFVYLPYLKKRRIVIYPEAVDYCDEGEAVEQTPFAKLAASETPLSPDEIELLQKISEASEPPKSCTEIKEIVGGAGGRLQAVIPLKRRSDAVIATMRRFFHKKSQRP